LVEKRHSVSDQVIVIKHLAVSIVGACIRARRRGWFFNVVDLVKKLDAKARAERQGRRRCEICAEVGDA
jgi:DNA replication protein DnaC